MMKRTRRTIYKNNKWIYYILTNLRPIYYKAKLNKQKESAKTRVSKDKFYREIKRLKRLNK